MTLEGAHRRFVLPEQRSALQPPEARGIDRDEVNLLVAAPGALRHTRFRYLPDHLRVGDLVVVNTSATLPAALTGRRASRGRPAAAALVHVSGPHPADDGSVIIEVRRSDGRGPVRDAHVGDRITLDDGSILQLAASYPRAGEAVGSRLWRTHPVDGGWRGLTEILQRHGRPITYDYLSGQWPLAMYQPVFARQPGGAEMASAGRPFTADLITELISRGVGVVPIVLHAGVSSLETGEPPLPEWYCVPPQTAQAVTAARRAGGRIVAVGTTVTRALETTATRAGQVRAGSGWTDLVLGANRRARVVDGLVTGWHAPDASHLDLLEAVAGSGLVEQAYEAALAGEYLWHEFGDSCLLLP